VTGHPEVRLYAIPGSHACRSAGLMLEHKGVPFRRVDLPTGPHGLLLRLLGFPGHPRPLRLLDGRTTRMLALLDRAGTVPALRYGKQRMQTNRRIARFLDEVEPDPPLFPADPERRSAVEEAERWGDEVLQMLARRVGLATAAQGLSAMRNRAASGRLGALLSPHSAGRIVATRSAALVFMAGSRSEAALLDEIPALLDRIDQWIDAGVLGGAQLNAADFVIVPSLALLDYRDDLREQIAPRPAGALLDRVLPEPAPAGA
jgi:glutathione S-transferase